MFCVYVAEAITSCTGIRSTIGKSPSNGTSGAIVHDIILSPVANTASVTVTVYATGSPAFNVPSISTVTTSVSPHVAGVTVTPAVMLDTVYVYGGVPPPAPLILNVPVELATHFVPDSK